MVGNAATIKIGSDVAGALAGLTAIQMGLKNVDKTVVASAAIVRKASLVMTAAFVGVSLIGLYGLTKGLKSATNNFSEFEQSAVNAASVSGKTGEEFKAVTRNVMEMSKTLGMETKFTAGITADALYDVASAGYDVGKMVKDDFKPVMDLAAGTQSELARTTHWVTNTLGQFEMELSEAGHVADIFAITIGNSKATLEKLGLSYVYVGTMASDYNDTLEDTSYLLGLMYNRGLRGEQAGRGMAMAYKRLAKPTAAAAEAIKRLGLTLEDVSPDSNTMIEILERFAEAGIGPTEAIIIFGQEAQKSMSAAIGSIAGLDQAGVHFDEIFTRLSEPTAELTADIEKLGLSVSDVSPRIHTIDEILNTFAETEMDAADALNVFGANANLVTFEVINLKRTMDVLSEPTDDVIVALHKMGLTVDSVNPSLLTTNQILRNFERVGLDAADASVIFGDDIESVLSAVENLEDLGLYEKILRATGFASLLAAEQLDTLKGTTQIFHSALEVLSIEIGEFSGYYLKGLNIKLTEIVKTLIHNVDPALEALRKILVDLGPAFFGAKIVAEKFKNILFDIAFILGFSEDSFDNFVDKLNLMVVSMAWLFKYIDEHPSITKFALAIGFMAISFSILLPIVGAASYAFAGLMSYLTLLSMLTVSGALATIGGSIAALFSPVILLTLLISALAAVWIFDIGNMRKFTSTAVEVMVDDFWWMIGKLMDAVNYIVEKTNEIRTALGFEPIIPMDYDVDKSREMFRQMGEDLDIIKAGTQTGDVFGGIFGEDYENFMDEYLDSMQQSIDYQAEMGEEYLNSKSALDLYNDSKREEIELNKQLYGFDITGMHEAEAEYEIDRYYGRGQADAKSYQTREDVNRARESGDLKTGDTYFIIDTVNTSSDIDDVDETFSNAVEEVD